MINKLTTKLLLASALSLLSATALAHPGHSLDESTHSFLHSEHIVVMVALGVAVFIAKAFVKK